MSLEELEPLELPPVGTAASLAEPAAIKASRSYERDEVLRTRAQQHSVRTIAQYTVMAIQEHLGQ